MIHMPRLSFLALTIVLVACSPSVTVPATVGISTAVSITPLIGTAVPDSSSGAVSVGTPELLIVTLTPIPSFAAGLGPTELKYRLLNQFPDLFFCDPDYYPVARMDEMELAILRFPEIQANPEEFNAILAHNQLAALPSFNDEQKLLIYQEYKKLAAIQLTLAATGYQFQLQSAKAEGAGELITGLISSQGEITVQQKKPTIATCPICLAEGMRIDTPAGAIPIEDLRAGMPVWTLDRAGIRIATKIAGVSKTIVPASHKVVHLVLEDGRELWASPGHPTGDGRLIGQLRAGDFLDGGQVLSSERLLYVGHATYDLLPAGGTGYYWANGVILASTLKRREGP